MEKFAANGRWLEWALYDVKRRDAPGQPDYECCPVGYSSVKVRQCSQTAIAQLQPAAGCVSETRLSRSPSPPFHKCVQTTPWNSGLAQSQAGH